MLAEAQAAGALAIVVGGTGLYFKALTEGLAGHPRHSARSARALVRRACRRKGVAALHALLAKRDPASGAVVRPSDPQRVLRALEVFEVTRADRWRSGRACRTSPLLTIDGERAAFVIEVDRPTLHRRIEERFDRMVGEGALDEVRAPRHARP